MPSPLPIKILSIFVLLTFAALTSYAYWGHYTRKVTVLGYLLPDKGLVRLYAPQQGIVSQREAEQGMYVHSGDVLLVISTKRSSTGAADVNTTLAEASQRSQAAIQTQITQTQALGTTQEYALKASISNLNVNLSEEHAQLATQRKLLSILDERQKKYASLSGSGLIPEMDIKNAEQARLEQLAKVQTLEQSITQLAGRIQAARFKLAQAKYDTQNQIAQYQQALSQADQQLTQYQAGDNIVLKAPVDGTVSAMLVQPGQTVSASMPLVTLMPAGAKLEARLLIPTRAMGFVKVGQEVRLRYDAFPYQHFGLYRGKVTQISDAVFTPSELPVPLPVGEPVYPVDVTLVSQDVAAYGHPVPLQPGMSLSADVVLNRERLIQWVFEPVYSLKGKI
ncbi:MAG TPA: HlyD family efflux transporter periplasmic adaptor subunit [Gammaproteobacteria bacterium]|nr:HlyD family efflux transporter periplasmic adaptor subunit [Gammaproteobacteria bacterium]